MDNNAKSSRFVGALSLAAAAALALSACATDNNATESPSPTNDTASVAASPTETTTDDQSPTTEDTQTATADDNQATGDDKFEDVIKVAEGEVSGSKAIDYEFDEGDGPDAYEIDVVDGNNVKHEIDIDVDGSTVTKNEQDDTLDGDDLKEFEGATVSIVDAVKAARSEAGASAVVDEVELEWEDNKSVWEVKFKDGTTETKVKVDAGSGDVISK